MTAYLLRTAAVRRRALHFAFRASHGDQTPENLLLELSALEADVQNVITGLPRRFHFNADNVFLHRDRLVTFLLLHVLRHNLFIVLGRAALLIYQNDVAHADLISQVRRKRISHALPIAGLISEGLKARISFDPQIGVHAYVALEILIFEPLRLAQVDQHMNPKAPYFLEAVSHLLIAIRNIAKRSEFVRQLYVEAVYRLLRYEYAHILSEVDVAAFRSEHQQLGEDAAEYDFRDFRWAKLERRRRSLKPPNTRLAGDESLLELKSDGDTGAPSAIPSPRLDAMDVNVALAPPSNTQTQPSTTPTQPCPPLQSLSFVETEIDLTQISRSWLQPNDLQNSNDVFSLDWASWLLERGGHSEYASGDFPESIDLDSLG
ncbi:hypothetical protein O1611_g8847 [Lasiodiplodia mahajangana]|uniref:Uncharacterized protein n=1 Tax=Lasiodiplodia mahajangana TaxID=1108764 RepID=A0ACC2JBS1_9PEZI|nr:hypothetical protein O1611_g8847 [Lasiodiplodia mahajangana]